MVDRGFSSGGNFINHVLTNITAKYINETPRKVLLFWAFVLCYFVRDCYFKFMQFLIIEVGAHQKAEVGLATPKRKVWIRSGRYLADFSPNKMAREPCALRRSYDVKLTTKLTTKTHDQTHNQTHDQKKILSQNFGRKGGAPTLIFGVSTHH